MKMSGISRKHRIIKTGSIVILMLFLACFFVGSAWCSSDGEKGAQGKKGWVATDTYRAINFVVLAVALFLLVRKPASRALNSRINEIKSQLDELEKKKKDAEEELARYNEKLSRLDEEAKNIAAEYKKQGNEAKARILEAAASAAEKLEAQALRNIEHEFKEAQIKLQDEIAEEALAKAEEKISFNITMDDQDKLINDYLDKVVAR